MRTYHPVRLSTSFQFTHPGGVRLTLTSEQAEFVKVSIHAPGRGATGVAFDDKAVDLVSIHAPGRGAT